ncbi:MAG: signal peptidase I [Lachnospiraceae bacterium]|nr:signal peptidase I [Lachnospiraceae bacterium]
MSGRVKRAGKTEDAAPKRRGRAGKILAAVCGVLLGLFVLACGILTVKHLLRPDVPADVFGLAPVMMTTDSMAPAIRQGDLMLIERCAPEDVRTGDVILFRDPRPQSAGGFVTHRVAEVLDGSFRTASDADGAADPVPVPAGNVLGRYRGTVPLLGSLAGFLKTVPGLVTAGVLAAAGIAVYELAARRKEKADDPRRIIDKSAVRSV